MIQRGKERGKRKWLYGDVSLWCTDFFVKLTHVKDCKDYGGFKHCVIGQLSNSSTK